ncbi:MAG: tRNA pseudouridine(55) synthase TruB, partial [Chloroflexota bacterium]|nr:tRNA pseudouridine(55) synthase TruB [Chloroflexota bacterium]
KLAEYHLGDEKEYRAVVAFGARSTTDDLDGELTAGSAPAPGRQRLEEALANFRGTIEQTPPDYSAVHVAGRRAYELARHGKKPELRPRTVTVHRLVLTRWDDSDPRRPVATFDVRCSAGTYVRALARDLGEQLGSGGYLAALTRTASGPFRLEASHSLDTVREALAAGRAGTLLLPADAGLETYPRVILAEPELRSLAHGRPVRAPGPAPDGLLRVAGDDGRLAAMAHSRDGLLHPEKVLLSVRA